MVSESEMLSRAKRSVLRTATWVNADQLKQKSNAIKLSDINDWLIDDRIFAINIEGIDYFALYCFDTNNSLIPAQGIRPVIQELRKKKDNWGIAFWFCGANGYLGGRRPQDLVQHQPDLVLEAAIDEILGITHG